MWLLLQEFNFLCLLKKLIDIKHLSLLVFQPSDSRLSSSCIALLQLCWRTMKTQMVSSRLLAVLQCLTIISGFITEFYCHSMMPPSSGCTLIFLLPGSCCCIPKWKPNIQIKKLFILPNSDPLFHKMAKLGCWHMNLHMLAGSWAQGSHKNYPQMWSQLARPAVVLLLINHLIIKLKLTYLYISLSCICGWMKNSTVLSWPLCSSLV